MEDRAGQSGIPITVFWLLAIWVMLVLAALVWGIQNAETKLRTETGAALAESSADLTFDVSGRDVTLYGTVASEDASRELAAEIDALPGVRMVKSALTVVEPPAPAQVEPVVSMRLIGDAVSIRGSVPSDDVADALVAAAEDQYGEDRVVNALIVDENVATRPWLGRVKNIFSHLADLRSGGFVADDDAFTLTGEVISDSTRTRIEQDAALVFGDLLPIVSNLQIAVLPLPTFRAESVDGVVTLEGDLPDSDTVSRIVDAARRLHPGSTIVNDLRVSEVAGPTWLDSIDGLLDVVTRLTAWTVDVSDGSVSITGMTGDHDVVGAIQVLAEQVVDGQLAVNTDIQIDPLAVAAKLTDLLKGTEMFGNKDSTLTDEGKALLDQVIEILTTDSDVSVTVAAYTDDQGGEAANLELTQQQAEAVVGYLVAGGIGQRRLTATGYGESQPIADNGTPEGRAQNRRIEFTIAEGDG